LGSDEAGRIEGGKVRRRGGWEAIRLIGWKIGKV